MPVLNVNLRFSFLSMSCFISGRYFAIVAAIRNYYFALFQIIVGWLRWFCQFQSGNMELADAPGLSVPLSYAHQATRDQAAHPEARSQFGRKKKIFQNFEYSFNFC